MLAVERLWASWGGVKERSYWIKCKTGIVRCVMNRGVDLDTEHTRNPHVSMRDRLAFILSCRNICVHGNGNASNDLNVDLAMIAQVVDLRLIISSLAQETMALAAILLPDYVLSHLLSSMDLVFPQEFAYQHLSVRPPSTLAPSVASLLPPLSDHRP